MSTILYAEDELFLGKIVKESLESRGFSVFMESDGNKVLPLFSQISPDICVLDVMLPNKDGFAIGSEIRKMNKQVPIIYLTAKTLTEDVIQGFAAGGNDYVRKPFSMEELIVRIQNLLKTGSTPQAQTTSADGDSFTIGTYEFNMPRQVLKGPGEAKKLSFREAELLKYLFDNREKLIDRRELLNALWGNDNFFNSRNLDVYITKLRGMLKEDPNLEILTIKGIGYRFVTG